MQHRCKGPNVAAINAAATTIVQVQLCSTASPPRSGSAPPPARDNRKMLGNVDPTEQHMHMPAPHRATTQPGCQAVGVGASTQLKAMHVPRYSLLLLIINLNWAGSSSSTWQPDTATARRQLLLRCYRSYSGSKERGFK